MAPLFSTHRRAEFWHPTKNGKLTPSQITCGSTKKCWFTCDKCTHVFGAVLHAVTRRGDRPPSWCPYCCTPSKGVCGGADCKICFERSFANHPKAKFWNKERNGENMPIKCVCGTDKKGWFDCNKCPHIFCAPIKGVTSLLKPTWCNYCTNKHLCPDADCQICLEKSFAKHPKAAYWDHDKNFELNKDGEKKFITPRDVFKSTNKPYHFKCDKCPNQFSLKLNYVSNPKQNLWCSCCAGGLLCTNENCELCYHKSLASHEMAVHCDQEKNFELNKDGEKKFITPREMFKYSGEMYWWKCNKCPHSFKTIIGNITREKQAKIWCPYCSVPGKKLCPRDVDCPTCHSKSVAGNARAAEGWASYQKSHHHTQRCNERLGHKILVEM